MTCQSTFVSFRDSKYVIFLLDALGKPRMAPIIFCTHKGIDERFAKNCSLPNMHLVSVCLDVKLLNITCLSLNAKIKRVFSAREVICFIITSQK